MWLAAHWDKKITKTQILETNIVESVDSILQPKVKLSLRTSSHLLLGIVRIYARKTVYLLQDCQDAAFKIKSAFRPDAVDLPDGKTEAAVAAITLPEMLDFVSGFDLIAEPPVQIDLPQSNNANVRAITLVEDISSLQVDDPILQEVREWNELSSVRGTASGNDTALEGSFDGKKRSDNADSVDPLTSMYDRPIDDDGFNGGADGDIDDMFSLPVPPEAQEQMQREKEEREKQQQQPPRSDSRMSVGSDSYSAPPSMAPSAGPSTPASPPDEDSFLHPRDSNINDTIFGTSGAPDAAAAGHKAPGAIDGNAHQDPAPASMVLDPLEGSVSFERRKKKRRKLGIIIDDVKTLSGEEMKAQLSDTSDIVTSLDLAPPSKKLMYWKKTAGSEKLFALPERPIASKVLLEYYTRNLVTNRIEGEEENIDDMLMANGDMETGMESIRASERIPDDLQLEQMPPPPSPRKAGLRPLKPREGKLEKDRSPHKRRKHHDKENHEGSQTPKSPRPKTPRMSDMGTARAAGSTIHSFGEPSYVPYVEDEDYGDAYDQPMSVGPVSTICYVSLSR